MPKIDLSKIDLSKIPVYVSLGGEVLKIATGSLADIRAAFSSKPGIAVDDAQLDKIDAQYSDRIEDAKEAASGR